MPTRNIFTGSRHAHYAELDAAPLDTSTVLVHQKDNWTDNRHETKPRLESQTHAMSNDVERETRIVTVVGRSGRYLLA